MLCRVYPCKMAREILSYRVELSVPGT